MSPTFTNTSHTYALLGLRVPFEQRFQGGTGQRTEPWRHVMPHLSRAESGISHLHSVGDPAVIRWRDGNGWSPLTCAHCGDEIHCVRGWWYHNPAGAGLPPVEFLRSSDYPPEFVATLWCADTIPGTVKATPVAPLRVPAPRTDRETLLALADFAVPVELCARPAEGCPCTRTSFDQVMESYLVDRYRDLRTSGRIFGSENEPHLEQHNGERRNAGLAFRDFLYRTGGDSSLYLGLVDADVLRQALTQAALQL